MKLIALAGRKGGGKSTLSNYLVQNENFEKISFADYLKQLISDIFEIESKYLYDQSLKESKCIRLYTDLNFYKKISEYIKEDITYLYQDSIHIETPRHLLQFVGTDILRAHDIDFHVKKTILKIKKNINTNFVCDDLRFQNELSGLRSVNVEEYFVIRPGNWNISNHSSETSIKWYDVKNVIVNNCDINILMRSFKNRYLNNNKFDDIIQKNAFKNTILEFDPNHSNQNAAFVGGFICQHKIKNNLLKVELDSIKNYLQDIFYKPEYIYNCFELENLKQWLDPKFPPIVNLESWTHGRNYYDFVVSN